MYFRSLSITSRIRLRSSGLKAFRGISSGGVTEPWGLARNLEVVVRGQQAGGISWGDFATGAMMEAE